jgi:cyclic beta-1,2-glucan synthetase
MATLLQIVCAEGERFSEAPTESGLSVERVRAAADELAENLILVKEPGPSRPFAHSRQSVRRALQPLLAGSLPSAQTSRRQTSSAQIGISEELRWLRENTRLLHAALQDTADLANVKHFPHVRTASGAVVPRVAAITEAFLSALDFRFDAVTFAAFLDSIEETIVLNVGEIWALVPCLKLLLLQEVASRASQLVRYPDRVYGVADCVRSLHHVGQTTWKDVLEPRILIDRILREDPLGAYASMDFESRDRYWSAIAEIAAHSDLSEMEVAIEALSLAQEAHRASRTTRVDPRLAVRRSHVGYYLMGEGVTLLHRKVGFRPGLRLKIALLLRQHPNAYYLSGIFLATIAVMATMLALIGGVSEVASGRLLTMLVLLLPCSQIAVELMNSLTTWLMPVQLLPKLDFSEGIPEECATVVAVPVLLLNESQVRQMAEHLEILYLGNRDPNLHFALLTDLPDSREPASEDDPRIVLCAELIGKLNEKYAAQGRGSFLFLHRHRIYNPRERAWMGWERKRGKLMDFARLLRHKYDSFPIKVGDLSLLSRVRFLITLDADTELPRGAAHRMVGTLAHPLNQAVLDSRNMVVSGFGVLQPRLGVSLQSAARSRLANILAGERGLDIYTRAVSDVYQDLYGDAIFTGKGIWEIDTLLRTLDHRFPENALLSHDLIEGAHARTGLTSDIELVDDYPSNYSAFSRRKHRWIRGDWQIAEWLLPRVREGAGGRVSNPLSVVSRWKIFDNLRRSLIEPAAFLMLVLGWLVLPGSALRWTIAAIALMFAPAWFHFVAPLLWSVWKRNLAIARRSLPALITANAAAFLRLTFLAHQTLLSLDAITRVLVRRLVTHRGLLEWETAAEAELSNGRKTIVDLYLNSIPAIAFIFSIALWLQRPKVLWAAAPVLLLWACSKPISVWLNQPHHKAHHEISADDWLFLRDIALRTWRYFAEHSNQEHHWLIPDNIQADPLRVADRTSPTDLGFLLNARQVACEMGYLTVPEFVKLTARTLAAMEALPKFRGHLFNWYSTRTLEPLSPRFISSVDSGNLVAALWSLREGCREHLERPLLPASLLEGFADYLRMLDQNGASASALLYPVERLSNPADWMLYMREAAEMLPRCSDLSPDHRAGDLGWFAEEARRRYQSVASTIRRYCPWLLPEFSSLRDNPALHLESGDSEVPLERLPAFIDGLSHRLASAAPSAAADQQPSYQRLQALLGEARQNSIRLIQDVRQIAWHAGQLAADVDFRFLLNRRGNLLSVGFDADAQQLMPACYDLLASEARLAVFVAIAKENISQEAWFLLGRTHGLNNGRPVLLSWTGTMFEYLMPSLWMRTYPETLLARAHVEAVRSQQAYAAGKHTPWGISESAYAKRDEAGNYQYSAFGIPPLALRETDMDSPVVSPYSTLLALPVDAVAALRNLRRMAKEGWLEGYGFCDAADYTLAPRSSRRHPYELVRCWMAHHQGMSILAIANLLHHNVVQRWFHNNPQVQATERLLQEKPVAWIERDALQRATEAA